MPRLMLRHAGFFFQNNDAHAWMTTGELIGGGQADNSATNDGQMEHDDLPPAQ
jgi:hypothetical protein